MQTWRNWTVGEWIRHINLVAHSNGRTLNSQNAREILGMFAVDVQPYAKRALENEGILIPEKTLVYNEELMRLEEVA